MIERDSRPSQNTGRWFWTVVFVSILLFATILVFQTREKILNKSIVNEGVALSPVSVKDGIDIYDGRELRQEFIAGETGIAYVSVGLKNMRGVDKAATVTVGIYDQKSFLLGEDEVGISKLWFDDLTRFNASVRFLKGEKYNISIKTKGVGNENALSVYYEPKINSLPNVQLFSFSKEDGITRHIVGHIGFKVIREPSLFVLLDTAMREIQYVALFVYALIILLVAIIRPVRVFVKKTLLTRLNVSDSLDHFRWREIVLIIGLGALLAGIVTAPFFIRINKMDSMGDVQRNLLFRALGRESLLWDGAIAQWDPYTCGGVPLLANIESAHTDPYFLLSLLFGENIGLRLSVLFTLMIGFVGTYLLARRYLGSNKLSAILAGGIYSFSGFQMLSFSTGVFAWIPVGLIPIFIYFYLSSLENNRYLLGGGFVLAWIFLGGGPHMPVFSVILVLLLTIGISITYRSWRPLLVLYLTLIFAALFSAVKLIPAAELVVIFDSFNRAPSFIAPLAWVPRMFIDRNQLPGFSWNFALTGENYRWSEFGSYIGLLPAIILICGLPFVLKKKNAIVWTVAGLVIFLMVFGYFPWTLIQQIPVLKEIVRNPQRLRSVLVLPIGLLVAYSLTAIMNKFAKKRLAINIVSGIIVVYIMADLLLVGAPNFYNLFNLNWPKLERNEKFVRLNGGYANEDAGYYKAGYVSYLANKGTTDLCVPNMSVNRPMMAVGKGTTSTLKPYFGEAYILDTDNNVEIKDLSPTKIVVKFDKLEKDGWLILNQNYYPGWSTLPKREVAQKNGLVAARVKAGDEHVTFKYMPYSFVVGFLVSLASIVISCIVIIKFLFARKREKID